MISLFVFQVKALQKIFLFAHSVFRRFTEQNKGLIIDFPIYIPNSFEKLCQQSPYFILFSSLTQFKLQLQCPGTPSLMAVVS